MIRTVWTYEWLYLKNSKGIILAWLVLLGAGIYAIYYGNQFVKQQQAVIHAIDEKQQQGYLDHLKRFDADTTQKQGKKDYQSAHDAYMSDWHIQKTVYKPIHPLTALAIGQADNQPHYYNLWVLNSIYAKGLQEIRNPEKLLAGNFDLSLVFIYLLPLLIVTYMYGMVSDETEWDTFTLIQIQTQQLGQWIFLKILFRLCVVLLLVFILFGIALIWNRISVQSYGSEVMLWLVWTVSYVFFWFGITWLVTSFKLSSKTNALLLLSSWLVILVLIPACIHGWVRKPAEPLRMLSAERKQQYALYDLPVYQLLDSFYVLQPSYKKYVVKDTENVKFVAYIEVAQNTVNRVGTQMDAHTYESYQQAVQYAFLNPAFALQQAYTNLAQTEIDHFLAFRAQVQAYQSQRRAYILAFMWNQTPFGKSDLFKFPAWSDSKKYLSDTTGRWNLVWLWVGIGMVWLLAAYTFHKRVVRQTTLSERILA